MTRDNFILQIPKNLNGCPIKIMTQNVPPYVFASHLTNKTTKYNINGDFRDADQLEGFEIKLIRTIADKINLRPIF